LWLADDRPPWILSKIDWLSEEIQLEGNDADEDDSEG
jgi:hypothetical protein